MKLIQLQLNKVSICIVIKQNLSKVILNIHFYKPKMLVKKFKEQELILNQ